jgi:hypothetical protein
LIKLVSDLSGRMIASSVAINLLLYLVASSFVNPFSNNNAFGQQLQQQLPAFPKISDNSLKVEEMTAGLLFPTSMAFLDKNGTLLVTQE